MMAAQLSCDMCQAEPATVMQSNLANGETVAVGDNCVISFYLTVLAAIMEGMPADVREEYGVQLKTVIDQLVPPAEPVPPAKPVSDRKRASRQGKAHLVTPAEVERLESEGRLGDSQPSGADSAASDG